MKHELKTHPKYFSATWTGRKSFEIRKNDRSFNIDDEVVLQEFDPDHVGPNEECYTGREIEGVIDYITIFEQKPGYVVFSLSIRRISE